MTEPRWLSERTVLAIHRIVLQDNGGSEGILNAGQLDSTLARPKHLFAYESADLARLAASYGYGLVKNHCFLDANKRTALMTIFTFLDQNGVEFDAPEVDAVATMVAVATDNITEEQLADWIRMNSTPVA